MGLIISARRVNERNPPGSISFLPFVVFSCSPFSTPYATPSSSRLARMARDDPTTPLNTDLPYPRASYALCQCLFLWRVVPCTPGFDRARLASASSATTPPPSPWAFLCFLTSHQGRSAGRSGAAPCHVLLRHWIEGPCRVSGARQAKSRHQDARPVAAC